MAFVLERGELSSAADSESSTVTLAMGPVSRSSTASSRILRQPGLHTNRSLATWLYFEDPLFGPVHLIPPGVDSCRLPRLAEFFTPPAPPKALANGPPMPPPQVLPSRNAVRQVVSPTKPGNGRRSEVAELDAAAASGRTPTTAATHSSAQIAPSSIPIPTDVSLTHEDAAFYPTPPPDPLPRDHRWGFAPTPARKRSSPTRKRQEKRTRLSASIHSLLETVDPQRRPGAATFLTTARERVGVRLREKVDELATATAATHALATSSSRVLSTTDGELQKRSKSRGSASQPRSRPTARSRSPSVSPSNSKSTSRSEMDDESSSSTDWSSRGSSSSVSVSSPSSKHAVAEPSRMREYRSQRVFGAASLKALPRTALSAVLRFSSGAKNASASRPPVSRTSRKG